MTDVKINDWLGLIELEVPEVPVPLVQRALVDALQEFCKKSKIWRVDLDLISVTADLGLYTPATPAGTALAGIRRMLFDGNKVNGRGEEWLDDNLQTDWRDQTAITPENYYHPQPDQIRLVFAPNATATEVLYVRAYLKPSENAEEVPAFIHAEHEYRLAIEGGAKSLLYRMEGTPWANRKAAESWALVFQGGMEQARGEAELDHTEEIMTMMTSPFGGIPSS